jgi:hypothetical protein
MALDSEAIWGALLTRLEAGAAGFLRYSRRRREWGIEEHPVLMLLDDSGDELLISDRGDPSPRWRLTGEIIILARNTDAESLTGSFPSELNILKRSVMTALERAVNDPVGNGISHYTDLSGLLSSLSVTRIEKGIGDKTGQALVKISLELETNPP